MQRQSMHSHKTMAEGLRSRSMRILLLFLLLNVSFSLGARECRPAEEQASEMSVEEKSLG